MIDHDEVVRLRDAEHKTFAAIGQALNIGRMSARSAYVRAKENIRRIEAKSQQNKPFAATPDQRVDAHRAGRSARLGGDPYRTDYGSTMGEAAAWCEGWRTADQFMGEAVNDV